MKFTSRKPAILVSALLALALAACGDEPTGAASGDSVSNMDQPPAAAPNASPDAGAGFEPPASDAAGFGDEAAPENRLSDQPTDEPAPGDEDFGEQSDTPVDDTDPVDGPPPADRAS